ncbi:hypothetical protein FJV46_14900 [Arthrobacter agilis]|uniref:YunG family protein n=1 Tax=Arthrobacter agilis TaxID=37921 RepID=UPI000B350D5C|nr:hypothetical protein [Arthrobacter agilis]OUM45684.1 hypothetical protein B8W74_00130 [Arthrobacter agilis]PPB47793.1 hypothetical protein CI784_00110 [Arthrobacter agilis]TPV21423.1 hypothetical protein FJV46_14900 [Arthrobacter agilis]VDR32258.1 Uncharacterised protein [Arthrobacter agilis]
MSVSLLEIERAFRQSWGADTTCLDTASLTTWTPDNSAHGQCGPTALVVQDLLGGDLLVADVTGGTEHDQVHYWNRFVSGVEIDLTREQFGPHHIIGEPRVVVRPPGGPRAYAQEYRLLRARVNAALADNQTSRTNIR